MIFRIIGQIIYTILLVIETLISLRFIFHLFGANAGNAFVSWIYNVTEKLISPFIGIINANWSIGSFVIDVDALVALIIYMIAAFVVVELIKVFSHRISE